VDPSSLPPGQPLLQHGPWRLWLAPIPSSVPPAWVGAFQDLFAFSAEQVQARWPLPEGSVAHIVLGGEQENLDWNVDEDALGFQALCTHVTDEAGDFLDVAHDHRCYVNVGSHANALAKDPDADVASALMTLPHEMGHVAFFAQMSGGRTPLEVFDQDGGELGLTRLLAQMEESQVPDSEGSHGPLEDVVESFARSVLDAYKARPGVDLGSLLPPPPQPPVRKRWFQR